MSMERRRRGGWRWVAAAAVIAVLALGRRPLLGTALLAGQRLSAVFVDGGDVRIVNSRPGMRRVLALTGLSRVFGVHSTVRDAVMALREEALKAS